LPRSWVASLSSQITFEFDTARFLPDFRNLPVTGMHCCTICWFLKVNDEACAYAHIDAQGKRSQPLCFLLFFSSCFFDFQGWISSFILFRMTITFLAAGLSYTASYPRFFYISRVTKSVWGRMAYHLPKCVEEEGGDAENNANCFSWYTHPLHRRQVGFLPLV
jgi:hypothetical protein